MQDEIQRRPSIEKDPWFSRVGGGGGDDDDGERKERVQVITRENGRIARTHTNKLKRRVG